MQPYIAFWFTEDEQKSSLTREVLTVWKVLGDFGGFMEIVMISCALLVATTQKFLFDSSVIKEIFMIEPANN
jgi:hypothetical protein